ncbi:helix-turn-helix domain-containing protein [Microbacterium sp. SSW1-47]|uniref:helix-turn-helix domain-containing protein n=1 Tax=Microbacterium sufflavum TaxID=2851649 RepID=UPI001FFD0333|nr:helix-turn-helix domain-containing protein [Microbacterium sufflavum]MCK2028108.1 helix-turn-helix domain-containing protein [Microbacterium sufflavum]
MSLEAFIWVSKLPLDVVPPTAFRVLLLLANHAHSDGRNVWRKKSELANELGCSLRTVERAFRDLRVRGLIKHGDQRLTEHLRNDRKPVVFDLNFEFGREYSEAPLFANGPTTAVGASASHDPTTVVGSHGPTNLSRPDEIRTNDPTTVVAHRTVIEPSNSSLVSTYRAGVGSCGHVLIDDRHCERGCSAARVQGAA